MKIKDIDQRLDFRCILSLAFDTPFLKFTKNHDLNVPAFLDSRVDLSKFLYIVEKKGFEKDLPVLLRGMKAGETDYAFIVEEDLSDNKSVEILSRLANTKTVSLNAVSARKGRLFIDFRFHNSRLNLISDIIFEMGSKDRTLIVDYLGKSPGITKILEELNSIFPITVVSYAIRLEGNLADYERAMADFDCIGEIQNKSGNPLKIMIYTNEKLPPEYSDYSIPETDNIYEFVSENPYLMEIRKLAFDKPVMRNAYFLNYKDNYLLVDNFMPKVQANDYVEVVMKVAEKEGNRLFLERVTDIDSDLWDWI
ncbi:MAG: hypothetical protein M1393_08045 [Candidatus Thermoplasmatota archaeon]|nr:hypothetical protein [Candidatus Thermoplasmatota archaeon]